MQIDVPTLYCLTAGTLCVAVAMTVWERRTSAHRARELGFWAASYVVFIVGCLLMLERRSFPGALGSAMANVVMVTGYFGLFWSAASFDDRRLPRWPVAIIVLTGLGWLLLGPRYEAILWNHASALPIAVACAATSWMLLRSATVRTLRSRPLLVAVIGGHGAFYFARATLFPLVVMADGPSWLAIFATATMFEAVLFSVAMPMAVLTLMREETETRLTAAAETDFLTGADNRRAFMAKADRILCSDMAHASVVVFDLDRFKTINDRHGHATGDEILQRFCRVAKSELSAGDAFGRLGGEEFAAVFRNCTAEEAQRLAIAISKRFTAEVALHLSLTLKATVSAGVSPSRRGAELAELLGEADGALYRAKKSGRDQTLIAKCRSDQAPPTASRAA